MEKISEYIDDEKKSLNKSDCAENKTERKEKSVLSDKEHEKNKDFVFSGCGIIGAISFLPDQKSVSEAVFDKMTDSLKHRGPNGRGVWNSETVQLGNRRLSILDASDRGAQPMTREHLNITYNGEVYNFKELKKQLEEHEFKFSSGTDTEIVLRAYQLWGSDAFKKLEGMFAIAIWDDKNKELVLARDPIGIKPLYFYKANDFFLFGSEVQALMESGKIPPEIDWDSAFSQTITHSFFQKRGNTLITGIKELCPGSFMKIRPNGQISEHKYWDLPDAKIEGLSEKEIAGELKRLLEESINLRLASDVPVASFLSGGLDSSAIVSIAGRLLKEYKLQAYTLDYQGKSMDPNTNLESADLEYSKLLAESLGNLIEHKIIKIAPSDISLEAFDIITDLASFPDDMRLLSILQNYKAINEQGLKVVLNGQGSDEIFGGYVGFSLFYDKLLGLKHKPKNLLDNFYPCSFMPKKEILSEEVSEKAKDIAKNLYEYFEKFKGESLERGHRFLTKTFLGRVLQFEDYISMQTGVECRLPFLDSRLVEYAFKIPFEKHIDSQAKDKSGKKLLREAVRTFLPEKVANRPKQAFPMRDEESLKNQLNQIYQKNQDEINKSVLVQRIFDEKFLSVKNPEIPLLDLWRMISMWRWSEALKKKVK